MTKLIPLPVDEAIPPLLQALEAGRSAVLTAPPGAGKTTRVPPALAAAPWAEGRILMLEPRRLAARTAAERMAEERGEEVGHGVGYRVRGESRVGPATRIEVVTEGILTRMLQGDPELTGIAAILFDEIHERSIHTDLGLALALEVQEALRPDLRLVAMSATLDAARIAATMGDCPVIESMGRVFPVETRWLDRPWRQPDRRGPRLEEAVAALTAEALAEAEGDALVFLPGAGEIDRTARALAPLCPGVEIMPLYSALPFAAQRRALQAGERRRVVLATAIAETSLTVEGVRIVVDAGLARRARVNPATGMSRLVTVPVSRAEADQRRGRAGRTAPGVCYRLWTRGEEGALPGFAPPEITETDLAPLALELALWGVEDPADLAFLDQPPTPALAEARALLERLGALEGARITEHGRLLASKPAHPRLAHMMAVAAEQGLAGEAALIAALLGDRDPLRANGRPPADLTLRLTGLIDSRRLEAETPYRLDAPAAKRIAQEARRLAKPKPDRAAALAKSGALLALAYPDRVGLRRPGDAPRYLLSGGRGAALRPEDGLAAQRLIVAAELEDTGREANIRLAAPLNEADLREIHGAQITMVETAEWSKRTRQVEARRREMFGAIALDDQHWRDVPAEALGAALADGIRERGLSALAWSKGAGALRARVNWATLHGVEGLPDWSDAALMATLDDWLVPHLAGMRRIEQTSGLDLHQILLGTLTWEQRQLLDAAVPASFDTPLGSKAVIDYEADDPVIRLRVQELFGVTRHPVAAGQPLVIELLSPAGRPVQTTRDLPGFWAGSYADVAKDMRARYPKHPWPDDPASAAPTRRAKPRG
ncbi:ATP-dependent helicase HrpB [Rhodobacteraceae bacterium NNCM2]|nr:ATP-dependent helicase HrpB [Coraliihabitans acroporae]